MVSYRELASKAKAAHDGGKITIIRIPTEPLEGVEPLNVHHKKQL
jgi:hypothetical protein